MRNQRPALRQWKWWLTLPVPKSKAMVLSIFHLLLTFSMIVSTVMSSNSIEDRLKAYDLQPGLGTLVMIYAPVKLAVWKTTHSARMPHFHPPYAWAPHTEDHWGVFPSSKRWKGSGFDVETIEPNMASYIYTILCFSHDVWTHSEVLLSCSHAPPKRGWFEWARFQVVW